MLRMGDGTLVEVTREVYLEWYQSCLLYTSHLTVTQFKVQAEQQRLEAVTGQVAQAEQNLEDAKAATAKQKKKLVSLQKETKAAKTLSLIHIFCYELNQEDSDTSCNQ